MPLSGPTWLLKCISYSNTIAISLIMYHSCLLIWLPTYYMYKGEGYNSAPWCPLLIQQGPLLHVYKVLTIVNFSIKQ